MVLGLIPKDLHGGLPPPVTLDVGDGMPSSSLHEQQAGRHVVHRLMQIKHTYTQNKVLNGGTGIEDGLEVKTPYCSSRGPRFSSQHLLGGSQPFVTPVPIDLMPPSASGMHT